ncbi:hypothetical protein AZE42_04337 [Rhizopogon vesiculosus]|uniref:Uncharacterized protein n=1 Tax=Rhizopogon vesiculosus TaxID=180088 RepID=A0A1J8PU03_9AGAM|nr:hypothetical protein AZE42_04337 [Rhizopogon vesiculosus]
MKVPFEIGALGMFDARLVLVKYSSSFKFEGENRLEERNGRVGALGRITGKEGEEYQCCLHNPFTVREILTGQFSTSEHCILATMPFRKIGCNVKLPALQLHQHDLLPLCDILECCGFSE